MAKLKDTQAGFGAIGIIAIVLIVGLIGVSGWLVMDRQKSKDSDKKTETPAVVADKSAAAKSLVTTSVKSSGPEKATVSVKHPSSWEVSNKTEDAGYGDGSMKSVAYIKSGKGNYLHITDVSGVGGSCDPDTDSYKLIKRLGTNVTNHYFSEYEIAGRKEYLGLADLSKSPEIKNMKEGETRTNTCDLANYSFIKGSLYASIAKSSKSSLASDVPYSELKDDPDFIAMLQSLSAE